MCSFFMIIPLILLAALISCFLYQKVIEETMENVPYMEQLIEHYSGPERVTAKQQQQELERVAMTLPENVPSSVKRFTDRAVLSLQVCFILLHFQFYCSSYHALLLPLSTVIWY